ncbi:MAG: septal ring lytic transglycosylase RlpA family protein [Pseudomonadota bacterium]
MKQRFWTILFAGALTAFIMAGCSRTPPPQGPAPGKPPPKESATSRPYQIAGKTYHPLTSADGFVQKGIASWYGKDFHGRKTANGEIYDMYAITAAHKTLPLGTWVRVENLDNDSDVVVRVNDRGPFVEGRIIDLSYTAAKKIGIVGPGTGPVRVVALGKAAEQTTPDSTPSGYTPVDYWKGNFTVQVGAFQDRTNAERLRARLSAVYPNTHITVFTDGRGTFYRVRTGQYTDLTDAESFARELESAGARSPFVVGE